MKRTIATLFMALALSTLASAAFIRPVPFSYANHNAQLIMMLRMFFMFAGI